MKRYQGSAAVTPRLLSIPDAAKYIGVHYNTICGRIARGVFSIVDVDGIRRLDVRDLDAYIEAQKSAPEDGPKVGPKLKGPDVVSRGQYRKGWERNVRKIG